MRKRELKIELTFYTGIDTSDRVSPKLLGLIWEDRLQGSKEKREWSRARLRIVDPEGSFPDYESLIFFENEEPPT